jgi:hypothetical protein
VEAAEVGVGLRRCCAMLTVSANCRHCCCAAGAGMALAFANMVHV